MTPSVNVTKYQSQSLLFFAVHNFDVPAVTGYTSAISLD